ncbi:protein prenylyltransferase [Xylariaceae sp. FL0016]|nr:protein prenylyltransferase [Xylariaceae sp. FL0016]
MDNHGKPRVARTTRTEEQRLQELDKINKYKQLEDAIRVQVASGTYTPALFESTSKLLRLNPEYYTIWNVRRRCLTSGWLSRPSDGLWLSRASPSTSQSATMRPSSDDSSSSSSAATRPDPRSPTTGKNGTTVEGSDGRKQQEMTPSALHQPGQDQTDEPRSDTATETEYVRILQSELAFTIPLLLKYPKCYWIWKYRKWVLEQAILLLSASTAGKIWNAELGLASKMLSKDKRNFHAWGYRRYVVARLESPELLAKSLAEDEFAYTDQKIKEDLSNFSAWHNRSRLMLRVLDERQADASARVAFLEEELALVQEALNVGPEDQSLWYYHSYMISQIVGCTGRPTIVPELSNDSKITYLTDEIEFMKDLLTDFDDVKWIYQSLLECSIALRRLDCGTDQSPQEDPRSWLAQLRKLDPMHKGRWDDLARQLE